VAWATSLQENVPGDRLARVSSYDALGSYIAIPLCEAGVGPLAQSLGARPTLLGCSVAIAVATVAALLTRQVRQLKRHHLDGTTT
jgi:hypothetical protein